VIRQRIVLLLALVAPSVGVQGGSFDAIGYWVGSGTQRAALVIDWSDEETVRPALVWGYRWTGAATGADMLTAVVAADPRLFAKTSLAGAAGGAVYGLGYDASGDRAFELNDLTAFDANGFAQSGPADLAESIDLHDFYAEGWLFNGFWHYGVAASNPYAGGDWASAPVGVSSRLLADGAWDAWTFTPSYSEVAFPQSPAAAPAPSIAGDYTRDGRVDAADYTAWRDTLGAAVAVAGSGADGDLSGDVGVADYGVWRGGYGGGSSSAMAVPEPTATWGLLMLGVQPRKRCRGSCS
jgi:hypothetical protein